ncbi:MAG: 7-cyano-7-deazaguanine synthase QueC [Rubricoccaceae bacterium]
MDRPALVLFSGGQDSTTCLFWALAPAPLGGGFAHVEAIAFDYGQRHAVELEQARAIAEAAGVPLAVRSLRGLLGASALTAPDRPGERPPDVAAPHALAPDLPAAFVPGRNALFLAAAASHAFARGIHDVVGGMCQADYSGYPDCRLAFVEAMQHALALALDAPLRLHTPLMHRTKAETWKLAADLGVVRGVNVLEAVREMSHTDYYGRRDERHAWGYGRLDNPASVLRARGYEEAREKGWLDA